MPERDLSDEIDRRIHLGDRLGLRDSLTQNEAYSVFCWHAPLALSPAQLQELWDAVEELSPGDVKTLLDTYLVGEELERVGIIKMLRGGVPVDFMIRSRVDPRLESAKQHLWGWRDVITLWNAAVSYEALRELTEFNTRQRTAVPAEGVAAMTRAQVSPIYMMEMLAQGVKPDVVARSWIEGIPAEYGAGAFRG